MRDFSSSLADFLGPFVNAAKGDDGPREVMAIVRALESAANGLRDKRQSMVTLATFHCCDCNRPWGARMTVEREREARPENCPACYNAKKEAAGDTFRSGWTDSFFYLDKGCPNCGDAGTDQGELNGYRRYCLKCSMGFD